MIDFELTAAQAALRDEAARWLSVHVPAEPLPSLDTVEGFELHRSWERTLADGGWAAISWPEEFGGRGSSLTDWLIFEYEYHHAGAPTRVNQNGLFLLAPTLLEYGTDAQKERFLSPMAAGEEIWAQGWSEPDAGSDMAAIRTTARREGDAYVLEGQKTWVSRGAYADWMFTLARTDPESARHGGLSFLLVPLDADGVSVRPIEQLDGKTGFAEVFLDGVEVGVENRIGEEHQGWKIAMATAGFERGIYLRSPGRFTAAASRLVGLCHSLGTTAPDGTRAAVTLANLDAMAYALHTQWTVSRVEEGASLGSESSFNKLFWSEMDRRNHELAMNMIGSRATLRAEAPSAVDGARWLDGYLFSLSGPIYAGTNEIQRNIIASRVLNLPRES